MASSQQSAALSLPLFASGSTPLGVNQASPVGTQNQQLDPLRVMMEHMMAQMARFEKKLEAQDAKISAEQPPPRHNPNLPYGVSFAHNGPSTSTTLYATQSPATTMTTTANPGLFSGTLPVSSCAPQHVPYNSGTHQWNTNAVPVRPPPISQLPHALIPMEQQSVGHNTEFWKTPTSAGILINNTQSPWDQSGGRPHGEHRPQQQPQRQFSSWDNPAWHQQNQSQSFESARFIKMEAPRFNGTEAATWVSRVHYYFDHLMMPEEHRLHYVVMLFDPPAAEWIFNYRSSKLVVSWSEFLEDVRRRFDPQYFQNFTGLIAKLC